MPIPKDAKRVYLYAKSFVAMRGFCRERSNLVASIGAAKFWIVLMRLSFLHADL